MKKVVRFVVCALFVIAALSATVSASAQSPLDGTWRVMLNQAKLSPKPWVFYLSQGWYHCVSCSPAIDVQADGQDHAVTGQPFDTMSVREVDATTIAVAYKKGGAAVYEETDTVSKDGKTLTNKGVFHPANGGAPVTSSGTSTRVGIAPSAVQATSGSWRADKVQASDNGLLFTYKTNGDEITMTDPTGDSYTAKFDGKDYPVKGAFGWDAVSLKRTNKNTFEETDKRDGKVTNVETITISADGKKMTVVSTDKITDRTSTYIVVKQ